MSLRHTSMFLLLVVTSLTFPLIASAWTGPSATPPAGNVATPINTSGTEQSKTGILDVYGLFVNGSSQYIYFGATNATTGFGIRNNAGTIEFKSTAGGTWQPFNSILQSYFATGSTNTVNQIRFADGTVQTTAATGSGTIPTGTRDDAGLQGNAGAVNGFFQSSAPVNYPTGASSWWHLLDVRHSNTANNYAMQIAGSFFDQELYFRKVAGTATTGWSKFVAENISGNVGIGNTGPATKLDVTGSIRATSSIYAGLGGANGYVGFIAGNSGNPGYVHWFRPDGTTRIAFMGWSTSGANNLNLSLENSAIFNINGGSVGIGATVPRTLLDVRGQVSGGFGAVTTGGVADWNDATNARPGNGYTLMTGTATNGPVAISAYFHPFSFEYSSKDGSGNMTQFAIPYYTANGNGGDALYLRSRYSGAWTAWRQILTENGSGRVGIGTATPMSRLHVGPVNSGLAVYPSYFSGLSMSETLSQISASTTSAATVYTGLNLENSSQTNGTYSPFISFSRKSDSGAYNMPFAAIGAIRTGVGGDTNWNAGDLVFATEQIGTYYVTEKMRVTGLGYVGIGTTNPGQKLDVVGNANISGNVTAAGYFHSSDATLKRNIQTASGLSTIEKLRGVTFTWKESEKKSSGVIAQEVEKVLPEAVQTDKQGLKSVDYDQLIAPLIEAVKEQQKIIEQQDTRIKRLESLVK